MIKIKVLSFAGESIYCGIDVHKKNWRVNIRTCERELEDYSQNADVDCFIEHVRRRYPDAKVSDTTKAKLKNRCW